MTCAQQPTVDPIYIGLEWRRRATAPAGVVTFPNGITLVAHVRAKVSSPATLAELTTENGGITRISDTEIELVISTAQTSAMAVGPVVMDIVRTDGGARVLMAERFTIDVQMPVTRLQG